MRYSFTLLFFCWFCYFPSHGQGPNLGDGQYHLLETTVNGMTRNYTLYEPPGYDGTEDLPVVFLFHGYSTPVDTMIKIAQMYLVADTANFFVVYPHGLEVEDLYFGGFGNGWIIPTTYGGAQNDVDFVSQMIDDLNANPDFGIDLSRVHATGWSNGGEFSYYLACMLSDKIASVASVANPFSDTVMTDLCVPARQISTMHIQGTEDLFFPASGDGPFTSREETAAFWAAHNNCDLTPVSSEFEDIDMNDNSTVTLFTYATCDNGLELLSYMVEGGGHTWPGGYLPPPWSWLGAVNQDIHASVEIWNFFNRNPLPRQTTSTHEVVESSLEWVKIYPNPSFGELSIEFELKQAGIVQLKFFTVLGQPVGQTVNQHLPSGKQRFIWNPNSDYLPPGPYLIQMKIGDELWTQPVLIQSN